MEDELLEHWAVWIRRVTSISEGSAKRVGIRDWVDEQRSRKWRLAGHMARRTDSRWSTRILNWRPSQGYRSRGRPCKRWGDEMEKFICNVFGDGARWETFALERETWSALEEDFVNKAVIG